MRNHHTLLAFLLAGTSLLVGCGSSDSAGTFGGNVNSSGNQAGSGQNTTFKVVVPSGGGTVNLPSTNGLVGAMTFAPGATEDTELTLVLSTTPPTGAPADGFYYLLMNVSKPLELSLLKKLRISDAEATPKLAEVVRPRALANDAELYTADLSSYSAGSATYLDTLQGSYDSAASQANFAQPDARQLEPNTTYMVAAKAIQQDTIPVTVTNQSGIEPAYITIVGQNPIKRPDGKADPDFYHVSSDGKMVPFEGSDRTTYDPLNPKLGFTDKYSIPLKNGTTTLNLPQIAAARLYVTLGRKMQIQINDYIPQNPPLPPPQPEVVQAQPNGWTNSGDPNYKTLFDWLEFDYKVNGDTGTAGIGINKSDVDQFGFGIQFTLDGTTIGSRQLGTKKESRGLIFGALQADPFFQQLIVPGPGKGVREDGTEFDLPADLPLRISAPAHGVENVRDNRPFPQYPNLSTSYFDDYLTEVWKHYKNEDLPCYTSAFGTWYGRVDANDKMVFTCVDASGKPLPGFDLIYLRKPTTFEAFEPTPLIATGGLTYQPDPGGPFVPVPEAHAGDVVPHPGDDPKLFTKFVGSEIISSMSAALNRTTLLHQALLTRDYINHPADLKQFYKKDETTTNRINLYAKVIHDYALTTAAAPGAPDSNGGGAAYAFGFDDNSNQSSFIAELTRPTGLTVVIPKFTP